MPLTKIHDSASSRQPNFGILVCCYSLLIARPVVVGMGPVSGHSGDVVRTGLWAKQEEGGWF